MSKEKEVVTSNSLFRAADGDAASFLERDWSQDDLKQLSDFHQGAFAATGFIEFTIRCGPGRSWVNQGGVYIPGNSIVQLHSHVGSMQMGWNRYVDPTGRFLDNGDRYRAESPPFVEYPDWNAFCFLVATPSIAFRNSQIPNYGASVGDLNTYWTVAPDKGGVCQTAFNDTDNNNSGQFLQVIRISSQRSFAARHRNLFH